MRNPKVVIWKNSLSEVRIEQRNIEHREIRRNVAKAISVSQVVAPVYNLGSETRSGKQKNEIR